MNNLVKELADGRVFELVADDPAIALGPDHAPGAQEAQGLGDRGIADVRRHGEVGDADRSGRLDADQKAQAGRIAEHGKHPHPVRDVRYLTKTRDGLTDPFRIDHPVVGTLGRNQVHAPSLPDRAGPTRIRDEQLIRRSAYNPIPGRPSRPDGLLYSVIVRLSGPRAAVTLLTAIPLPGAWRDWPDRGFDWRAAMWWAPLLGLSLGATAAGVLYVFGHLLRAGELLAAVLAIGSLALLTRGMHLDGLADLADGLASRRPADAAIDVMKRSDLGPNGAVTLIFVLLIQVAALTRAQEESRAYLALLTAGLASRLALTWICRRGVPSARPEGLGAQVAGTVHPLLAVALGIAAAAFTLWLGVVFVIGLVAGLVSAELMCRLAIRRLGGITGDVLGAATEVAFTACLLATALR